MLSSRRQRQRAILAAMAVLGILLGALAFDLQWLDSSLQAATYDTFITQAPAKISNQVTIVALDDKTQVRYGRFPIPRQAYVDLLNALKPLGPRSIAFDIAFYDESPNPDQDRALANAIKDAGNVILAMQGAGTSVDENGAIRFNNEQVPITILRQAAAGLAAVNVLPDEDSRVRKAALTIDTPSGRYYSLPLVATARSLSAAKVVGGDERALRRQGDLLVLPGRSAALPDRQMPIDERGLMAIYYAAPPATELGARPVDARPCADPTEFCVVSLADVVAGSVPRELIANRTVLIGAHSISAVPDNYAVPNSGGAKMWGVEIWANTASSIFTNRFPQPRESFPITLVEMAIVTCGGILLVARFRLYGFLGAIALLVAYGVIRFVLFSSAASSAIGDGPIAVASFGYLVPGAFWWVVALGYLLVEEQRAVTRTQTTFGRFVTPSIARTIMDIEESGHLALGGEEKRVTVLFGDVRGFTTLSEGMTPRVLLDTLNRYFDGIVNVVNRYEGTVNKYNGDNIMVIWGAPLPVEDQARKAVQAALEIQRWIVAERAKGGPDVSFGFGINTGPVVAGFLGAMGRMEYTVIGDTANVASRLTSSDIARRDQVAVSAETLSELGPDVVAVDLGAVQVKGRAAAVRCYQVNSVGSIESPNPAPAPERPIGAAAVAGFH
ncbi:MAG TPA: adenylate/guanylate cyclase domain-containing protein [Candidatus Limnocylindria bacterium]|nr:adenylate/guanylate cyclase domain-containing protein [Candidatus Limnocylindria bacterium]